MAAAQTRLAHEHELRLEAVRSEEKAIAEARAAKAAAREAAKEQRDAERRMLISAGGMRDQREKVHACRACCGLSRSRGVMLSVC